MRAVYDNSATGRGRTERFPQGAPVKSVQPVAIVIDKKWFSRGPFADPAHAALPRQHGLVLIF
jgi:hypothetical protein